ncbi:VOC family protein [Streptomyces sp. NPDC047017]|uniref:VOC family protein n=1 Tax=Streptomyces sp. NPDC047017 TaxID=3155024 RepID=UPI0033C54427
MTARPDEGTPCWADAMFTDVERAEALYADVLGWTFGASAAEYGNYVLARADGSAVAAVVPPAPGQQGPAQWCLHLASPDAAATAARVRDHGGEVLMQPMRVGDFGTMCLAREPGGAVFGVWQGDTHEGFEATAVPGAYCWAEIRTREPERTDAFFTAVFDYTVRGIEGGMNGFRVYDLGGRTVLGRMRMTDDLPPETPSYIEVYFTVADCDAAVAAAGRHGSAVRYGPADSPFGRWAALTDPQGARFSVIDITTARGEKPQAEDVVRAPDG